MGERGRPFVAFVKAFVLDMKRRAEPTNVRGSHLGAVEQWLERPKGTSENSTSASC